MKEYQRRIFESYQHLVFKEGHDFSKKYFDYILRRFNYNYLPHFPQNKESRILEIACGRGEFIYAMQKNGYSNIESIDISSEQVKSCQAQGYNVLEFSAEDFLPERTNVYDVIIFNELLQHICKEDILDFLDMVYNSLKADGIVFCRVPNANNPFLGLASRYIDFTHEVIFTEISLRSVFKTNPYKTVLVLPDNIYTSSSRILNYSLRSIAFLIDKFLFSICFFYGRKSSKIFTKFLIAVAKK